MKQFLINTNQFLLDRHLKRELKKYVDAATKDFNFDSFSCNSLSGIDTVCTALKTPPMMADSRVVVIKDFEALKNDEALKIIEDAILAEKNIHVFIIASKIDKRSSLYKKLSKSDVQFIEFKELYPNQIPGFLIQEAKNIGLNLSQPVAQHIYEAVGTDLNLLVNELEKLKIYMGDHKEVQMKYVEDIVAQGVLNNIFALSSQLGHKNFYESYKVFHTMVEQGESLVKISAILITHFRKLLLTKEMISSPQNELAKVLKVHPFFIKDYLDQAKLFQLSQLQTIFRELMKLSVEMRQSRLSQETLFLNFIQSLCV